MSFDIYLSKLYIHELYLYRIYQNIFHYFLNKFLQIMCLQYQKESDAMKDKYNLNLQPLCKQILNHLKLHQLEIKNEMVNFDYLV